VRDICFVNGEYTTRENARVSVEDRGYQFADGVYEVIRFHGRRGLKLDAHLERMQRSCDSLRITGNPSIEQWHVIIDRLIEECELPDDDSVAHTMYIQVSRGVCPRSHPFPTAALEPSLVAYFRKAPVYTEAQRAAGVALSAQPDERWERCHIKSVALLPVVLAKQAAIETGAFEALLVRNGKVTEGGATNAYCVRDGVVYTHPEGRHILSGVTRALVFEAAQKAGVDVREEAVTLEQFRSADEAFISSTTMDIMPATKLDGAAIGSGKPGPVTQRLIESMQELVLQDLRGVSVG